MKQTGFKTLFIYPLEPDTCHLPNNRFQTVTKSTEGQIQQHKMLPLCTGAQPLEEAVSEPRMRSTQGMETVLGSQHALPHTLTIRDVFPQYRVSLQGSGCPRTHSVDYVGLELRELPPFASLGLGLKVCTPCSPVKAGFLRR